MNKFNREIRIDAEITPDCGLDLLSQAEVNQLLDSSRGGLYDIYRRCSLAVLPGRQYEPCYKAVA